MLPTTITDIIGYVATVVGVSIMLPQIAKAWQTRHMKDVSSGMVVLYILNCLLWLTYGIRLGNARPMIIANGLGFLIGLVQLGMKIAFG